jgi:uncharacterized protein (TIGR03000 family)
MPYSRYYVPGTYSYGNYYYSSPTMVMSSDGTMRPYQAGYSPAEEAEDNSNQRRDGRDRDQDLERDGTRDRGDILPPPGGARAAMPATLVVHLPEAARLKVDDTTTKSTSDRRVFTTPPLEPGKTFHYTLTADLERDGKSVHTSRTVEVHAGRTSEVYMEFPSGDRNERRDRSEDNNR